MKMKLVLIMVYSAWWRFGSEWRNWRRGKELETPLQRPLQGPLRLVTMVRSCFRHGSAVLNFRLILSSFLVVKDYYTPNLFFMLRNYIFTLVILLDDGEVKSE